MTDPIVGIDLGTSNSVVAYVDPGGAVSVLADEAGDKVHPSVVSFHPAGGVVVGSAAKQRRVIDPKNTIYSAKRLIGRSFGSPEVTTARSRMAYPIKEGPNQQPMIVTRGGEFAVPEISAIVLDHVRNVASTQLKTSVERAVVTVPATFNDAQRSATATAGAIAGLAIIRVLNEPTAAALAYGNLRNLNELIAVYDFGGGTFDISILRLQDDVYEVLGTAGDTFLGGDDLDERLVDRMVDAFLKENRVDLRMHEVAMMRLRAVAEQTKIELSRRSRAVVRVDEIAYGPNGKPLDLQIEITREEFVGRISDIVDRTFPVCQEALHLAGIAVDRISDVVLVGGTTKIPHVRDQVSRFFGRAPRTDVGADDAVAIGAALQARALDTLLSRKSPARAASKAHGDQPERPREAGFKDGGEEETATQQTVPPPQEAKRRPAEPSRFPRADTERPAERGRHHDRMATPPPIPAPTTQIGRMTRNPVRTAPTPSRPFAAIPTIPAIPPTPQPSQRTGPPATQPLQRTVAAISAEAHNIQAAITLLGHETVSPPAPLSAAAMANQIPAQIARFPLDVAATPAFPPPAVSRGNEPAPLPPTPIAAPIASPPQPEPEPHNPIILDVTPRGLGIATVAGYCEELIKRNSRVPTEIRKLFSTSRDGQDAVRIIVCQGESRRLEHNVVIGDLTLSGLLPKPRGETSLEVTFALDASGILRIRARDAHTGREQRASLDLVGAMPQAEVEASRERLQRLRK